MTRSKLKILQNHTRGKRRKKKRKNWKYSWIDCRTIANQARAEDGAVELRENAHAPRCEKYDRTEDHTVSITLFPLVHHFYPLLFHTQ